MANFNKDKYFESDKIKVFPSAYRNAPIGHESFDQEAIQLTEKNLVRVGSYLKDNDSYVVKYSDGVLHCIIGGYYFEITTSPVNDHLCINLTEDDRLGSLVDGITGCLDVINDADNKYYFTGLMRGTSTDGTARLLAFKDGEINQAVLLPKVFSGDGENAVILNQNRGTGLNSASGVNSLAHGYHTTVTADGTNAHAEGTNTIAANQNAHAEGVLSEARGTASHAEGQHTIADNSNAHSEGRGTVASGADSHAEGALSTASGQGSHAEGENTTASGKDAHAEGIYTKASGKASHAEGGNVVTSPNQFYNEASGDYSHAEGQHTTASAQAAHAEGTNTEATEVAAHAEGLNTTARAVAAHAEGGNTNASGDCAHTEGINTKAEGAGSHAEGGYDTIEIPTEENPQKYTVASGKYSHAEGVATSAEEAGAHSEGENTVASGIASHAEGIENTTASSYGAHAEGQGTIASAQAAHAEGQQTTASGEGSHTEGKDTIASNINAHAEGYNTTASGDSAHSEGVDTEANGEYSHAEGDGTSTAEHAAHAEGIDTQANGIGSHAEGNMSIATGDYSHAEGTETQTEALGAHTEGYQTSAKGNYSHAEGSGTSAQGVSSHTEGVETHADSEGSHAEGLRTRAAGLYSHAEGIGNGKEATAADVAGIAKGIYSHSEGENTKALGEASHAEGCGTVAHNDFETVVGKYNAGSTGDGRIFVVGNGTAEGNRKNAFEVLVGQSDGLADGVKILVGGADIGTYIKNSIVDVAYPVGSIYTSTEIKTGLSEADQAKTEGCPIGVLYGGYWKRIKNTFLYAADDEDFIGGAEGGTNAGYCLRHQHHVPEQTHTHSCKTDAAGSHIHPFYWAFNGRGLWENTKDKRTLTGDNGDHTRIKGGHNNNNPNGGDDYSTGGDGTFYHARKELDGNNWSRNVTDTQIRNFNWELDLTGDDQNDGAPRIMDFSGRHTHLFNTDSGITGNIDTGKNKAYYWTKNDKGQWVQATFETESEENAAAKTINMPRYLCVYIWKRIG